MKNIVEILAKELRDVADRLESGTCQLSVDEAMDIVNMLAHEPLSKESACEFMNMSRATFDNYVALKLIPKGRKRRGFKELVWYKNELQECIKSLSR